METKQKKKVYQLQLNNMQQSDDPTKLDCTFVILDFEVSHNNAIISKEDATNGLAQSIINKPIVAHYSDVSEPNTNTDHFEGHNVYLDENKHGELTVRTDTIPIGVFTTEGYVSEIDTSDGKKEVLLADAILWKSRFEDATELLLEWYNRGININTSCEVLYSNYSVQDGIEHINAPIWFEGHTVLNSEERGDYPVVLPAYDSSKLLSFNEINKFNKLVAQAINQEKINNEINKECEKMGKFKKVFELSHQDVRSLLYSKLDPTIGENTYSWISDVYDTYFIVELESYVQDNEYDKYFKFNYTKTDTDVTIDFESKTEVTLKRDWIEVTQVQQLQNSLDDKAKKVEDLEVQLNEATSKIESLTTDKTEVEKQFNEATEKLTKLNSQVDELKPFKEHVEKEKYEKSLNEKKEFYSDKFKALNAEDKLQEQTVQDLIAKSVFENEEGNKAVLQLNSMLVDMVKVEEHKKSDEPAIKEFSSKRKNLIPNNDSFESRYSL